MTSIAESTIIFRPKPTQTVPMPSTATPQCTGTSRNCAYSRRHYQEQ